MPTLGQPTSTGHAQRGAVFIPLGASCSLPREPILSKSNGMKVQELVANAPNRSPTLPTHLGMSQNLLVSFGFGCINLLGAPISKRLVEWVGRPYLHRCEEFMREMNLFCSIPKTNIDHVNSSSRVYCFTIHSK